MKHVLNYIHATAMERWKWCCDKRICVVFIATFHKKPLQSNHSSKKKFIAIQMHKERNNRNNAASTLMNTPSNEAEDILEQCLFFLKH